MHHLSACPRRFLLLAGLLVGLAATPLSAQDDRFGLGLIAGTFEPVGFSDTYDALYDETFQRFGARFEWGGWQRWRLLATVEHGSADGELVVLLPDGSVESTGEPTELTLTPVHLTLARELVDNDAWEVYLGAGLTVLSWEESSDFSDASGTDPGIHALVGARRMFGRLGVGAEVAVSAIPDALPEDGLAGELGEDGLGGLSLRLVAVWGF